MDAEVEEPFRHVHGRDARLILERPDVDHELVHAGVAVGDGVVALETTQQVGGIEDRIGRRLGEAFRAERLEVGERSDDDEEVAVEPTNLAHGGLGLRECVTVAVADHGGAGEVLRKEVPAAHGTGAGTASAMRRGEGLVQVHVRAVEAHVARACVAHDGVEVGAVVVAEATRLVDDAADLDDVGVKEAERVGVGEHEAGRVGADGRAQRVEVDAALVVGGDRDHGEARHDRRRGVGAMRGVGDDDLGAAHLATLFQIVPDEKKARVLTVGTRRRLQGQGVHAEDLLEVLLDLPHDLETALDRLDGLERVDVGEAGQSRNLLVDLRVVLHGAGAERVEAVVHAVRLPGELGVVATEVDLGELGQTWCRGAQERLVKFDRGYVELGYEGRPATGHAAFEEEPHRALTSPRAATSASIWHLVFISVQHQRMPPSTGSPARMSLPASAETS